MYAMDDARVIDALRRLLCHLPTRRRFSVQRLQESSDSDEGPSYGIVIKARAIRVGVLGRGTSRASSRANHLSLPLEYASTAVTLQRPVDSRGGGECRA